MTNHRIDLLNPNFSKSVRGYSPTEVDCFLQEVASVTSRLGEEKLLLSNKVEYLEQRVRELEEREKTLQETLVATQRTMEDMKDSAQREAQLVLESARSKAENLVNQGSMRLARIMDDIAEANKLKMQFEFQLRSMLAGHLKLLEMGREEQAQILKAAQELNRRPGSI